MDCRRTKLCKILQGALSPLECRANEKGSRCRYQHGQEARVKGVAGEFIVLAQYWDDDSKHGSAQSGLCEDRNPEPLSDGLGSLHLCPLDVQVRLGKRVEVGLVHPCSADTTIERVLSAPAVARS